MTTTIQNSSWWKPFQRGSQTSSAHQLTAAVANGIGKTIQAGVSGALHLLNPVGWIVPNQPEMMLHLHFLLEEFISGPFTQVNRNELAERLEDFIKQLNPKEKAVLENFCNDLKDASVEFPQERAAQLRNILSPYLQKHANFIQAKVLERKTLEMVPHLTNGAPAPPLSNKEAVQGITDQIELLKSNAIKKVLGTVMLNMTMGISTIKDINPQANLDFVQLLGIDPTNAEGDLVTLLIEASNKIEIKNSHKIFTMLIERVIDNSDRNIFLRYQAKLRCKYLSKLISSSLTRFFDKLKIPLIHFANLSPQEQLQEITALLITPLSDHLSDVKTAYSDIDQYTSLSGNRHRIASSIPKILDFILNTKKPGTQTSEQLLDNFIEVFLNEFIDPIHQHWTRTTREYCLERASQSTFLVKGLYKTLAGLSWVAGKIIAPLQWSLNEAIRLILKKTISGLFPSLMGSTKGISWHGLKNNLLIMLQQTRLNRLRPRTADPAYLPEQTPDPAIQENFNTLIDQLLKVLVTQDKSSIDINRLGLVNFVQSSLHGTLKTAISRLAVNLCSQEEFFNEMILSTLKSTNTNTFAHKVTIVSDEEKKRVEQELEKELSLLGENIVVDVREDLRSDKQIQAAANVFVNTLKQKVRDFEKQFLKESASANPAALELLYSNFINTIEELREKIQGTTDVDAPTKALLLPYINQCLVLAKTISETLRMPTSIDDVRSQVEQKLNELTVHFKNPLAAEEEIVSALAELKALDPTLDIDALENEYASLMHTYTSKLLRPRVKEKHPTALSNPLTTLIAAFQKKADKNARRLDTELRIQRSLRVVSSLVESINGLNYVKVAAKPGFKDAGFALALGNPLTSAVAGTVVQSYGKNLLHFISQGCHIEGIVKKTMAAYIKKPPMKGLQTKTQSFVGTKFPYSHIRPDQLKKLGTNDWAVIGI